MPPQKAKAVQILASTYGLLAGLAGLEHGFFEILQGNHPTPGLLIHAIGPAQQMWAGGVEPALTLVPNFLATGLLAMSVGLLVMLWSVKFIQKPYGGPGLIGLSILQLLVGGGVAPIFLAVTAGAIATQIHQPLNWWLDHFPEMLLRGLARLWPWSLAVFLLLYFFGLEVAIGGWFFGLKIGVSFLYTLAYSMIALWLFVALTGFAHDAKKR